MVLGSIFSQKTLWKTLMFCHLLSAVSQHTVMAASECDGGQDVFTTVKENSLMGKFIANLNFTTDPSATHINLSLTGKDADWFYLEGKTIRLNSSSTRILDREAQGPVLTASVRCYEHEALQAEYRIMVEVLNENDNKPEFLQNSIQPVSLSELTAVNSVAFTVQATDADGDTLTYVIDETSPDASYFWLDLPNSGRVMLNKSLDYERKTQLQLTLYAVEMNTDEHYNTTTTITINVTDGDDQYPQFQPCILLSANHSSRICANPVYTANITEHEQDVVLEFSPGPIQAVDGDAGLQTGITYTILSGADNGRFVIDSNSGEVRLTRHIENRLLTPTLRLRVMAAQTDDPMKYAVATVLVRVLAENKYPPQFNRSAYRGFISESTSPASLVMTYGNKLLILETTDQDFTYGFNPRMQYSLSPEYNSSQLFYITQEGLLIARTNHLHPNHKYVLEVLATDQESGDIVKAVVQVDVLQKGQPVPQGPLGAGHPDGSGTVGRAEGVAGVCLILLAITLFMLVRCIKRRRERRDPAARASVAECKHPNVSLRWFHLVNHGKPMPLAEEHLYHNEAFSGFDCTNSPLYGKQGIYTKTEEPPPSSVILPFITVNKSSIEQGNHSYALRPNGRPASSSKTVSFRDFVVVRECDVEGGGVLDTVDENMEATTSVKTEAEVPTASQEINTDCVKENPDSFKANTTIAGINTDLQSITLYSENINVESEMPDTNFKEVNTDYDITTSDPTEVKPGLDKVSTVQVHSNLEKISYHITNLELPGSPKDTKIASAEDQVTNENQQKDNTVTHRSASEDATQVTSSVSKELYIIDPKALISELNLPAGKYVENSELDDISTSDDLYINPTYSVTKEESNLEKTDEAGIQDKSIQITAQDTDSLKLLNTNSENQNTVSQEDAIEIHQLNTMTFDPVQHNVSNQILAVETENANTDLELAKSNTYYICEDSETNLDNVSPEARQESLPNLDTSDPELNLATTAFDRRNSGMYSADTQIESFTEQPNSGDETNDSGDHNSD